MPESQNIKLILENGTEIKGYSFGFPDSSAGEVVFNTAMTGYPESLTDPSYKGQILILTYPLIGNYGVPASEFENNLLKNFESDKIHISGLIISDYSFDSSHWKSEKSLSEWLIENKIPAIYGVDTRMLTKIIREKGSMLGKIIFDNKDIEFYNPDVENLVDKVSIKNNVTLSLRIKERPSLAIFRASSPNLLYSNGRVLKPMSCIYINPTINAGIKRKDLKR